MAQSETQLLGCIAVTSKVDISALQQNFELQAYDQLVQPEACEAAVASCTQRLQAAAVGQGQLLSSVLCICKLAAFGMLSPGPFHLHAIPLDIARQVMNIWCSKEY